MRPPRALLIDRRFAAAKPWKRGGVDYLTFSYADTIAPPAGTCAGRVTYTIFLL